MRILFSFFLVFFSSYRLFSEISLMGSKSSDIQNIKVQASHGSMVIAQGRVINKIDNTGCFLLEDGTGFIKVHFGPSLLSKFQDKIMGSYIKVYGVIEKNFWNEIELKAEKLYIVQRLSKKSTRKISKNKDDPFIQKVFDVQTQMMIGDTVIVQGKISKKININNILFFIANNPLFFIRDHTGIIQLKFQGYRGFHLPKKEQANLFKVHGIVTAMRGSSNEKIVRVTKIQNLNKKPQK